MKPNRSIPSAQVIPVLVYPDVREAVAWLGAAFGFVERLQIGESTARNCASAKVPSSWPTCATTAGRRGRGRSRTPSWSARTTWTRTAPAHGGTGRASSWKPTDLEYGERQYAAADLAGHEWTYSQTLEDVDPVTWGGTLLAME
jgi:uncharacterized glyoxalase superfamily protein PhnB